MREGSRGSKTLGDLEKCTGRKLHRSAKDASNHRKIDERITLLQAFRSLWQAWQDSCCRLRVFFSFSRSFPRSFPGGCVDIPPIVDVQGSRFLETWPAVNETWWERERFLVCVVAAR